MMGHAMTAPAGGFGEDREPLSAFVADDVTRELIARVAAERGWPNASIQAGGVSAAARALAIVDPPRVLMVDISDSDDPVADIKALIGMLETETRVVVLGTINDVGFYRQMLAVGAADYLLKPTTGEAVREAIAKAEASPQQGNRAPGRLAVFIGARGGVGASTLATNCAWIAANSLGRQAILVDLDLQFGTVALSLDLDPGAGLREALSDPDRIDDLFLERAIVKSGERLSVLGGEEPLDDSPVFESQAILKLMGALTSKFDFVAVDLPSRLAIAYPDLLSMASELVVVCDLSLASLRDVNRLRRFFKTAGCDGKVTIVANLVGSGRKGQLGKPEFEKGLEGQVDHIVPHDEKTAAKAANLGMPLATAGRSPATAALNGLATALVGTKPTRRGFKLLPSWIQGRRK